MKCSKTSDDAWAYFTQQPWWQRWARYKPCPYCFAPTGEPCEDQRRNIYGKPRGRTATHRCVRLVTLLTSVVKNIRENGKVETRTL